VERIDLTRLHRVSAAIHKERRGCQIAQAVAPQAQAASRRGWGERRMCEALGLGAWGLALGAWRAWLPFFFLPQPRREAALEPWVLQHVASHPKHVVRAALAQLSPPLVLVLVALPRHRFSVPRHCHGIGFRCHGISDSKITWKAGGGGLSGIMPRRPGGG